MEYFWLLSVQAHSDVIRYICDISNFQQPCISQTTAKCSRSGCGHSEHCHFFFGLSSTLYLESGWSYSKTDTNLGLGSKYLVSIEYLWYVRVLGHSEVIWCIYIYDFRQPRISKRADYIAKRTKIWPSEVLGVYMLLLTVKCSRSFWGHSMHMMLISTSLRLGNG